LDSAARGAVPARSASFSRVIAAADRVVGGAADQDIVAAGSGLRGER